MSAPFLVQRSQMHTGKWVLWMRKPLQNKGFFNTQAEAIDHAYKHWPWSP